MQDYTYSVFSIVAIAIHLIFNYNLLLRRGVSIPHGIRYRGFLIGVLAYYVTDAAWGIFAGLGWTGPWYVDTVLFFLALVVFIFMWCRFVVDYLGLGKWAARIITWSGYSLLALNLVALAVNPFANCFFHFDAHGVYQTDYLRNLAFFLLVSFDALAAVFALVKASQSRDAVRRRSMMAFLYSFVMGVAIVLQIIWPLTPFTALGCLVGNCFFHVFVVQDEQMSKHMDKLERALDRAKAAEKARSLFFSIVSHDIRTPLNAILGYSELLQYGVKSQAERDEAINSIRASGTTLLQLVNDVLDLAKMDSGKMMLQPQPVPLARLIDEVFSSFKMAAAKKGIELFNRTANIPVVMLDGLRFRQILFNLIGNAVKFTERGSVTVAASYSGGNLEVSVADTGPGIPSDMLTRILDPFVQVLDPSHAPDRAGGTGLGLSICRRLVEAMGGKLVVESELGKGSTFRVHIPGVATGEERSPAPRTTEPTDALENIPKRVLVVDDSPVNRSVITLLLKRAGVAAIDHAEDGAVAVADLDSSVKEGRPYDLVLSDFWMPNMNGLELIEKIRADHRISHLPVFAVTADTEYGQDARSKLFTGVLLKPLTYAKLLEALRKVKRVNPVKR